MDTFKYRLRDLYEGDTERVHRFRYGLLVFDVATILFIVASSFTSRTPLVEGIDVLIDLGLRGRPARLHAHNARPPMTGSDA